MKTIRVRFERELLLAALPHVIEELAARIHRPLWSNAWETRIEENDNEIRIIVNADPRKSAIEPLDPLYRERDGYRCPTCSAALDGGERISPTQALCPNPICGQIITIPEIIRALGL